MAQLSRTGKPRTVPTGETRLPSFAAALKAIDRDLSALDALLGLTINAAGATFLALADPGADRIAFWDESNNAAGWLSLPTGLAISGTGLTLANDLAALEALASTGFAARTGSDAWAQRSIAGTANEITIANGDGVSGNPTASLPSALTFTGKTVTGGTYTTPTINGGSIQSAIQTSGETSGTLTSASANKVVTATGGVTINDGVFAAGDIVVIYAGSSSRTITQDTGMTLRLHGSATTGSRTLAARGVAALYFVSNSEAIVSGDVT